MADIPYRTDADEGSQNEDTPQDGGITITDPDSGQQNQVSDGIMVQVFRRDEETDCFPAPFGDVRRTELPTLLRKAANNAEKLLGV